MRVLLVSALFLGASLLASSLWSEVAKSLFLEAAFLDVGQGDALYLETPHGHQVLIDGGPDAKVLSRLGEVMPFWDKSLDVVILTHPDADHITGLVSVLESYEVKMIVWTGRRKDTKVFRAFEEAVQREGAEVIVARAGQKIVLGESGAFLAILYPTEGTDLEREESNETSIITMLRYGKERVLLPGDTTAKVERMLLESGTDLKAGILKVAHHGSKTSSSFEFLKQVSPETAVISVGKDNRFGHPAQEVLANLRGYGIEIQRTDEAGTIFFYFNSHASKR